MSIWRLLVFTVFVHLGCGYCPYPYTCEEGIKGQCDAERIVWREVYGEPGRPPTIQFDNRISFDDAGQERGAWGMFHKDCWSCEVVNDGGWHGGAIFTAFPHELLHAHMLLKYGDTDHNHQRDEWGADRWCTGKTFEWCPTAEPGLLDIARKRLDAEMPWDLNFPADPVPDAGTDSSPPDAPRENPCGGFLQYCCQTGTLCNSGFVCTPGLVGVDGSRCAPAE